MNDLATDRVSDAPADIWVYRLLPVSVWPYAQLARWDRPIGWWLLLWPCWWSLALAIGYSTGLADVAPSPGGVGALLGEIAPILAAQFVLFWLGAVMMRGAGCTYNDYIDCEIDAQVARTASRPIPSGRVSKTRSLVFLLIQALVGLLCLLGLCFIGQPQFNVFALILGVSSLVIVACYPFAKRITNWPQLVLGLAFSWGGLMGWAVVFADVTATALLLYLGSILWVIGYDTIYAHQDIEDDALVGVRSTARLFGDRTKPALLLLYSGSAALFALAFASVGAGWPAFVGLAAGFLHMLWQIRSLDIDDADNCLTLFKSNTRFGWILFAGILLDWLV